MKILVVSLKENTKNPSDFLRMLYVHDIGLRPLSCTQNLFWKILNFVVNLPVLFSDLLVQSFLVVDSSQIRNLS